MHKMDEVTIYYKTTMSDTNEIRYGSDTEEIRLSGHGITEIDLTPVRHLPELRSINLIGNSIRRIDLSPLAHCTKLRFLQLERNQLEDIDLSPLASLTKFDLLTLERNNITELNLTALFKIPQSYLAVSYDEDVYIQLDDELRQLDPWDFSLQMSIILRQILSAYPW